MKLKVSNPAHLPSIFGDFTVQAFIDEALPEKEHLAIISGEISPEMTVRIHSECLTGDALGSCKCDCRAQLEASLRHIAEHGGLLLYLRQEGRGIGLFNKINAYSLQDAGADTVEANRALGLGDDERDYAVARAVLAHFGITRVRLLSNNPLKLAAVGAAERVPLVMSANPFNREYLAIKKHKMGHLL